MREILAHAGRRWVSATGRRGVIKGRLPAHFRLIFNRVEMATRVQGTALRTTGWKPVSRPRTCRRPERKDHGHQGCGKLRKKCFQTTEIILSLTLACSGLHAQASQVQTFPLSGAQDLDARNVKLEPTEYKGRKAICITLPVSPAPAAGPRFTFLRGVDFADGTIEADVAAKMIAMTVPCGVPGPDRLHRNRVPHPARRQSL